MVFTFEIKGLLIMQIEKEFLVARNYKVTRLALNQIQVQYIPDDR